LRISLFFHSFCGSWEVFSKFGVRYSPIILLSVLRTSGLPKLTNHQTTTVLYHILNKSQGRSAVFFEKNADFGHREHPQSLKAMARQAEGKEYISICIYTYVVFHYHIF
jgi:hypothetical protein